MTVAIELSNGMVTTVDRDVYPKTLGYSWNPATSGKKKATKVYAAAYVRGSWGKLRKRQYIRLHDLVMGPPPAAGMVVDHIDGNTLNNTKANLRFVTSQQNARNSSKKRGSSRFKGVYAIPSKKWVAVVSVDRFNVRSIPYRSEEEAATAYDQLALRIFGEHARCNGVNCGHIDAIADLKRALRNRLHSATHALQLLRESEQ